MASCLLCSVLIEFGLRFEDSRGRAISSVDWVIPQIVRGERPRGQGLVLEDVLPQLWTGFICCPALAGQWIESECIFFILTYVSSEIELRIVPRSFQALVFVATEKN